MYGVLCSPVVFSFTVVTEHSATARLETDYVFVVGGTQADAWFAMKTQLEKTEVGSYLVADAELRSSHSDIYLVCVADVWNLLEPHHAHAHT
jgi:hypothetical protein